MPGKITAGQIQCISISSGYVLTGATLLHDIAIGTDAGQVFTFQIGGSFSNLMPQPINPTMIYVSAVAFSPRYSADMTMLAVAADGHQR